MADHLLPRPPFAEVVVNRQLLQRRLSPLPNDDSREWAAHEDLRQKTFHYSIPTTLESQLQPGHLVAVPFRREELQGVVVALSTTSPVPLDKLRPITALLAPDPILSSTQLQLARWLSETYLAPLTTCVNYFLPPGSNRRPQTVVELLPNSEATALTPLERALELYLQKRGHPVPLDELEAATVDGLLRKGRARKHSKLTPPKVGPRLERTVELQIDPDEIDDALLPLGRPSKQAAILIHLASLDDPLPQQDEVLIAADCVTTSPLYALADKGYVDLHEGEILIGPGPRRTEAETDDSLSPAQQALLHQLPVGATPLRTKTLNTSDEELSALLTAAYLTRFEEPARVSLRLPRQTLTETVIALRGTEKHAEVLHLLADEAEPVWVGWVYAQTEANINTLRTLADAKLITLNESRRWRDPLEGQTFTLDTPPPLTEAQKSVLQQIRQTWAAAEQPKPFLLHGVTGSGKTEIYLQLIADKLAAGQQILFLVPEVMLATQIVQRVQARFPQQVALWHSSLSPGERFDTWERVHAGELSIIVGPRSALFAPVHHLGLIIIDEEHEPAYKQQNQPTFHAREVAVKLATLARVPLVMGSATPDVVSYRRAQRGEYQLLSLPTRILAHRRHLAVQAAMHKRQPRQVQLPGNAEVVALPMPPVEIVDLREELKAGNRSIFSNSLREAIAATLAAGEQVILFLNRRGTATFVNCRDCGHVLHCPRCDTTLTYHAPDHLVVCHYCGYHTQSPARCPNCSSHRIRYFGLGTERVEETLRREFPDARALRFDRDTTRQSGSHFSLLQHFTSGQANVMIGTQMVAKGLDLPLVTLVGVISADTALYLPDFRAAERTFQLLMQVSGRAGRSPLGGRVIIQTYTPDQPAIIAASEHDYHTFYQDELHFRYEQSYPPFKRLARLLYAAHGYAQSRHMAEALTERIRLWVAQQGLPAVEIIGPTPAYVQRIRAKFRWQILVRAADPAAVLQGVQIPLGWKIDIDPVNLL